MTAAPFWARGDQPSLEAAAQANLAGNLAATKLHLGGTGRLPVDQDAARFELTEEQRHSRGTRPSSSRWKALTKIDEEIDRITERHSEAIARLTAAEEELRRAPETDARTLAAWLSSGEKGSRPSATIDERRRDRDAAQLLVAAVAIELDGKLEARLAHIERHRNRMLADAQRAIDDAHKQLLAKVSELPELRQALLDARETMLWASHFPERPESFGFETAAALGLRAPLEKAIGVSARVEYTGLLAALTADADALSHTFSSEQQKRGLGEPGARTPLREAMWDADPDNVKWKRAELERARQLAEFHPNVGRVADEARDFRT